MSYVLSLKTQIEVLRHLVEGNSISSTSRLTSVHRNTLTHLMERFGTACMNFLDREMRDLSFRHLQIDEMWTYCRKKRYRITGEEPDLDNIGDFYIFVALDHDTRLIPAFRVDRRDEKATLAFMTDLASRLRIPQPHETDPLPFHDYVHKPIVRISTDGFKPYVAAIEEAFGGYAVHAILVKSVTGAGKEKKVNITKKIVSGEIDEKDVSTSLVERSNLTFRNFMKRLARKTMGYSKKLENLRFATAMHVVNYNYCRVHKTLKTTPAKAAGLVERPWKLIDLYEELRSSWPELFFNNQKAG